ncbi:MAG: amino acid ABC transporter permease [Desulfobacterales bacterium]|nr:amino acid ABC transporter permease [Desulfobacterales bacterium]MCF8080156.1 amino acid ABC transporter permease [Desulfobacterales bacterium]
MPSTEKNRILETMSRVPAWDLIKFAALVSAAIWLLGRGTEALGYNWQWYRAWRYLVQVRGGEWTAGPLMAGLWVTIKITLVSLVLAFAFGLLTAAFRLSHSAVARALARIYLEIVRNTPLLVQLFFLYFVLSPILGIHRWTAAILALSLFEGAYASEIVRAGILSIGRGQWEAADSLGFGKMAAYRYVILPQALRRMLPPLTSQAISLIKDSALVSTIAIYDLTMRGQAVIAETYLTFEIWFIVAALYLLVTVSLSIGVNFLENRLRM